jgi:hypothetical protein
MSFEYAQVSNFLTLSVTGNTLDSKFPMKLLLLMSTQEPSCQSRNSLISISSQLEAVLSLFYQDCHETYGFNIPNMNYMLHQSLKLVFYSVISINLLHFSNILKFPMLHWYNWLILESFCPIKLVRSRKQRSLWKFRTH